MTANSSSGISDVNDNIVKIYPNPCTQYLKISLSHCSWELYDMTGRILTSGSGSEVDVQDLKVGNYILRINTADGVSVKKFLKR
ncbi:MAG: T9SS type A sorting domain-containing protein [bacterium]|nr:T9SS type A sorting domain-containing protein [bacterium]